MTPRNPYPIWSINWEWGDNLRLHGGIQFLTWWWCPKGSPFWHRHPPLTRVSESGDNKPSTSRYGPISRYFSPIPSWTKDISHHHRQGRIHSGGTKHIWCTAAPSRRASQGNRQLEYYFPGNADAELQYGNTGTIQCSPYQLQISIHGTIGTEDCDNELNTGATQDFFIGNNEPNKYQEEVLLLELR